MSRPPTPVFLDRGNYRRRRLMDAVRLLPVVGALLFLLPLLWTQDGAGRASVASTTIYIFAVWAGLIAGAVLLSRALGGSQSHGDPAEGRERAE